MSEQIPEDSNEPNKGFKPPEPVWVDRELEPDDSAFEEYGKLLAEKAVDSVLKDTNEVDAAGGRTEPESYVTDKAKAEIMAHATKLPEDSIVHDRKEVINLLASASEYEHALPMARQRTEEIKNTREHADTVAQQVADTYDEVNKY